MPFQKDEGQLGRGGGELLSLKAGEAPRPAVRGGWCHRVLDHAMLYYSREEPVQLPAPCREQETVWKGTAGIEIAVGGAGLVHRRGQGYGDRVGAWGNRLLFVCLTAVVLTMRYWGKMGKKLQRKSSWVGYLYQSMLNFQFYGEHFRSRNKSTEEKGCREVAKQWKWHIVVTGETN